MSNLENMGLPILKNSPKHVNEWIRERREKKMMSLKELANKTKIAEERLEEIESGSIKRPSKEEIQRLSGALGIEYSKLLFSAGYSSDYDMPPFFTSEGEKIDVFSQLEEIYAVDSELLTRLAEIVLKKAI